MIEKGTLVRVKNGSHHYGIYENNYRIAHEYGPVLVKSVSETSAMLAFRGDELDRESADILPCLLWPLDRLEECRADEAESGSPAEIPDSDALFAMIGL